MTQELLNKTLSHKHRRWSHSVCRLGITTLPSSAKADVGWWDGDDALYYKHHIGETGKAPRGHKLNR